jgi:hypothetical protein
MVMGIPGPDFSSAAILGDFFQALEVGNQRRNMNKLDRSTAAGSMHLYDSNQVGVVKLKQNVSLEAEKAFTRTG